MTLLCVCQLAAPDNEPLVPAQRYIMTQRQEAVKRQRIVIFGYIFGALGLICSRFARRPHYELGLCVCAQKE